MIKNVDALAFGFWLFLAGFMAGVAFMSLIGG